ncbi:MAG TPA: AAA family ATPase [Candidatus Acidoferrales bacterium]|nr:AAA family ATPase [Candidatus Acidoferrales bacterium]
MKSELPGATGRLISFEMLWDEVEDRRVYPFSIPALAALSSMDLDRPVTFLVGENGSGKSTLIEALAVAAGLNPEGGSQNLKFSTRSSHSPLHEHLRLAWRGRPHKAFFLRAESFYNVASAYDKLREETHLQIPDYHLFSHGESFLEVVQGHFRGPGLYLMDEPESALSVLGQLQLLIHTHQSVARGGQFVIASHSPILTAFPEAVIYRLNEKGIKEVGYTDTEPYQMTKSFLESPPAFLHHLFAAGDEPGT